MERLQKPSRRGRDPAFFDMNGDSGMYEHAYDNGAYYYQTPPVHPSRYPRLFSGYPYNGHGSWTSSSGKRTSDDGDARPNRRCLVATFVVIGVLVALGIIGAVIAVVVSNSDSDSSSVTLAPVVMKNYTGEATLKDVQFKEDYNNPDSDLYKQTEQQFIAETSQMLRQDDSPLKDKFFQVQVQGFREGSVVIIYLVTVEETEDEDEDESETPVISDAIKDAVEVSEMVEPGSVEVADVSACESDPCLNGGTCTGVENYSCVCVAGYTGTNCETDIDECASNPCQNGANCTNHLDYYTCDCVDGYSGVRCDIDIDECQSDPCENGGSCVDGVDSYTCDCVPGYTGIVCETDINECESNPCVNEGTCNNEVNMYSCTCASGFTGVNCRTNINECQSAPCLNGATCNDDVDFYTCTCAVGFTGLHCEINIDDCASGPCENGGMCDDGINSFTCSCMAGYTGMLCQTDIQECDSGPCMHGGSCIDEVNSYSCTCAPGYTGTRCETNKNECMSNPCMHDGTCNDGIDMYTCTCMPGYTGVNCQTSINECGSSPCLHGGSCTDYVNFYTCTCLDGFMGDNCETDINECQINPCLNGGSCMDGINKYTCDCRPGFTGTLCQTNVNECGSNPCRNGGSCTDGDNHYACVCLPGFMGDSCETNINECQINPCQNGGTCVDGMNQYTCVCPPGYTGTLCQTVSTTSSTTSSTTKQVTLAPMSEPSAEPTYEPGPEPTYEPSPEGTYEPGPEPTYEPSPEGTYEPGPEPTYEPEPEGTYEPGPEPTYEPEPEGTYEPWPETTHAPTVVTTPTPLVDFNCSAGYEKLEIWIQLPYLYSPELQNRSSDEFATQAHFVNQLVVQVQAFSSSLLNTTDIVYFQSLNGMSVSTVLTCVALGYSDPKLLYTFLPGFVDGNTTVFLGLQVLYGSSPAAWTLHFRCPPFYLNCTFQSLCIPYYFVCDGFIDCYSGADENSTYCNVSTTTTPVYTSPNTTYTTTSSTTTGVTCDIDEFACATLQRCIPIRWVCDGYNDCGDYSDEVYCGPFTSPPPTTVKCGDEEHQCHTSNKCVNKTVRCDGNFDCEDRSDEWYCPTTPIPRPAALEVRLMDGDNDTTTQMYGRVEVRPTGTNATFGTICDDMWGAEEAEVICRQLGYTNGEAYAYKGARFGMGTGPVYLGSLRCTGEELNLMDCESTAEWGYIHCGHNQDASVSCGFEITTMAPPTTTSSSTTTEALSAGYNIELINGSSCLSGLVQVTINGVKGMVCDDYFGQKEADVTCRSLGFSGAVTWGSSLFDFNGPYSTPILMDDVSCSGEESSLFDCSYLSYHNCGHYEDVGVICEGDPAVACYDIPIVGSVNCSFNLNNCGYKSQTTKGDNQWRRGRIWELYNPDAYMYLTYPEGSARLTSPQFNGSDKPLSVEFMYSIINSHYNNLILSLNESTMISGTGEVTFTEHELWNSIYLRSDEDSRWLYHCQELETSVDKKYNLIFDGTNSADTRVALDNVNITSRKCKESLLDGKCTFDRLSECGMSIECNSCNRESHPYRWYWGKHDPREQEMLIHVKSVFGEEGDKARVTFKIPYINKMWYLRFKVLMGRHQTGSLRVTLDINNREFKTVALITGSRGYWFNWCAKLSDTALSSQFDVAITFEATRGADVGGMVGDIYLDDIEILTNETCSVSGALPDHHWMITNSSDNYTWIYKAETLEGSLRLTDGGSPSRGFLEVYHDGEWRGICNYNFGSLDLRVVCRSLGFLDYRYWYSANRDMPFWLSNIRCRGYEADLSDCIIGDWGKTPGCYSSDHVFAVCLGTANVIVPYFPMNVFYINDSEVMQGAWTMLTSMPWMNNTQGSPRKFLFEMHKQTSDVLSVWWQDGSSGTKTYLETISKTVEYEKVCVDFTSTEDQFMLGITAWKATGSKSILEVANLEEASGYCQGPIGQEFCDFQSEYVGCKAAVTTMEHGCINQYKWETVSRIGQIWDYTMKSSLGRFMYISNANGVEGDVSMLKFETLDIVQDFVPFACSLKFVYFLRDGDLTVDINGRNEQLSPLTFRPYMWRQGCFMISPGESCPLQSGMVNISFVASGVEAGLDDVHISAETCYTGGDITCEFENMDSCGYTWNTNLTVTDGVLKNQDDIRTNFTIVSPIFQAEVAELCIAFENKEYTYYNLSATLFGMNGDIINSTSVDNPYGMVVALNAKTNPGESYILFIEGLNVSPYGIDIAIDYVHLYNQSCSNVELPCRSDNFTCGDGKCIPSFDICDGKRDCGDGKDEQMCECPSYRNFYYFHCATTSYCVRSSLLCDGVEDCEDGSDETCEPSLSCTFEDTYYCGYSFYNYNSYSGIIASNYLGYLGYLESAVVAIETESCYTVAAEVYLRFTNQSDIRFIANMSNSLSVLSYANLPVEKLYYYSPFVEISVTLPVGEYSVIFETRGMHVIVANISLVNGTCIDPNTTAMPTSNMSYPFKSAMPTSNMLYTLTTAMPSSNMSDANTTMSTSLTNSTTTPISIIQSLPVVNGTSPVYGYFGEDVELTCTVTGIGDHEIVTYWYMKTGSYWYSTETMISRNADIMLEDEEQTKYSASLLETGDDIVYTLNLQVSPSDSYHVFICKVDVIGEPHHDQFDADVYFFVPVPEEVDSCVPNPFYACHEAGYPSYKLPSVTGLTSHSQVYYKLLNILYEYPSIPSDTCQSLLRDLSCGLHTPNCTEHGETIQVCRESCEDIASICADAYPSIVFNNNEDIDYFCKFLPRTGEDTCNIMPLECGSQFNTTAKEFRVRSEYYPSVPQSALCTYTFFGPPAFTYFNWFKISIENLTLDADCDQSYLKVGNETLCSDAMQELPKVISVERNTVELMLARGDTGKFVASFQYDLPWDLCNMYYATFYNFSVEATADLECSRWIFILRSYYQPSYKIKLVIESISGCIYVNDNTGADPMVVCAPETLYIQSHNATVTKDADNTTFTLQCGLISNNELEKQENRTNQLVPVDVEIVSFGSNPVEGTGFVRVYRSDGVYGVACNVYGRTFICEQAGYVGLVDSSYKYSPPDDLVYLTTYLDCDGVTSGNLSDCSTNWQDGIHYDCFYPMYLICEVPSVACNFSRGSCGYTVQEEERYTNALSPVFRYTEGTSLSISLFLLGNAGDHGYMSLVKEEDGTELALFDPATPIDDLEGAFDLCLPLPNEFVDMDVRLNLTFSYATKSALSSWLYLTVVELHEKECPGAFPETTCSFDDLAVCEPFIEATCTNSQDRVWKIAHGQLNGDAKQGTPLWPYSFTLPLPEVTAPTTKFFHFSYMNNGSFYYQNQLNVTVTHYAGGQEEANWTLGYSQYAVEECLQVDLVPSFENYLKFELLFNHSLGFVSIDDVMWNDVWCPHPASCDFERDCHLTIAHEANTTTWWNVVPVWYYPLDHTYEEIGKGHYVSLYVGGWDTVGTKYWFTINATAIDSQYHCLSFFYMISRGGEESSNVFFTVHANYSTATESEVKMYGVAEFRDTQQWEQGQVPIITDGPMDKVAFTFMVIKLFDNSPMNLFVDDISFETFTCKYGIANMEVCTFDEPMKCMYSANCTEGSGYLWSIHRESENPYLHVVNSFGDEEDQSHVWFDVDLSAETSSLYYQFYFLSSENAGTLETYLEITHAEWGKRKKREVLGFSGVQLDGRNIWQVSDCYSIPGNFSGRIYFLATRGMADQGHIGIDNVEIVRGTCVEPSIACNFTQGDCGYPIAVSGWVQTDSGISSQTEGMGLYVPLHKLQYQNVCLSFNVQLEDMMSALTVMVAMANKTEVYRFGQESGSSFTGQLSISRDDIRSVQFLLPANTGDAIRSVAVSEGLCSLPRCGNDDFLCEEKCILLERRCDGVQDCHSGIDEDSCGYSLACTFESGDRCSYEDVSEHSGLWKVQNSFTYTNEDGIQQTITPDGDGGLVFVKFDDYSLVHAELKTIPSVVHSDSCLVFTYAGTVSKLEVTITYDNGTVIEWQDTSVKGDTLDWKPAMIDIAPGHVAALIDTSMVTKVNYLPKLVKGAFLVIDDIILENQRCVDVQPIDCPNGTVRCADRSLCYPEAWQCNGIEDCPDGSDEDSDFCLQFYTLDCTFEEDFCYYQNIDVSTNSYWTREQAFVYEHPQYDHTYRNKSGHFLYLAKVFSFSGIAYNATVESTTVLYDTDVCVSFQYFMNSTRWQTNSLTAQLFVTVVYTDGLGMSHNLLWYDSADRYFGDWVQGNVPIQANRTAKLWLTAKTFTPVEIWPGMVAVDDIQVTEGDCPITQECRPGSFECTSSQVCIPGYYRCDGTAQCYDGSDEESCDKPDHEVELIGGEGSYGQARVFLDSVWHPVCFPVVQNHSLALGICRNLGFNGLAEAFKYRYPDTNQIPVALSCTEDGVCVSTLSRCSNYLGVRCSHDVCFYAYGLCPRTKDECIPDGRFCDGLQDCFENTDELDCAMCHPETEMECLNHECIPIEARCNGTTECRDGSDELRCIQVEDGRVTAWVGEFLARKPVCFSTDLNKETADELCRLSGLGYLQVPGIQYGLELVPDGVMVFASGSNSEGTLQPGLDIVDGPMECRPLNLTCVLPECGTTAAMEDALQPVINSGEYAALGEWPWHCSLYKGLYFNCGASYIGNGYFLTAAHCVDNYGYYTVRCGTIKLSDLGPYGMEYNIVGKPKIHPQYDGRLSRQTTDSFFDVAVIQTATPPIIDNFTRPICLGNAEEWQHILDLGNRSICYTAGYGQTEQQNVKSSDPNQPLKETRVRIQNHEECEAFVVKQDFWLYDDSVCIQNTNPYGAVCPGDSGSALVCKDPVTGRWKQFALSSLNFRNCDNHELPDMDNAVFPYLDWIYSVTGLNFERT